MQRGHAPHGGTNEATNDTTGTVVTAVTAVTAPEQQGVANAVPARDNFSCGTPPIAHEKLSQA